MMKTSVFGKIIGRCIISDDLGNIILDKTNAIHPTNMSRAFARALANESNFNISRFAFGNGGTFFDATNTHTGRLPNNGINDKLRYKSRLYNETYSEYVDDSSSKISTGPGSSPQDDPTSTVNSLSGPGVVSKEVSSDTKEFYDYSQIITTCVLNKNEPTGQYLSDVNSGITDVGNSVFEFDEIALFTDGIISDVPTSGYQTVSFNTPNTFVKTSLDIGRQYNLTINVDGIDKKYVIVPTTISSDPNENYVRFKDLVDLLNKSLPDIHVSMDNGDVSTGAYFGYMTFTSKQVGSKSVINIKPEFNDTNWLFGNIPLFVGISNARYGTDIGEQNNPDAPDTETARMLTHLIFEPIRKPMNRTYIFKYILDIHFITP